MEAKFTGMYSDLAPFGSPKRPLDCDLWSNILPKGHRKLELLQRYFARSTDVNYTNSWSRLTRLNLSTLVDFVDVKQIILLKFYFTSD